MEKRIILNITGMTCNHCVMHVTNALKETKGVKNAEVSLEQKEANITAKDNVTPEVLISAVEGAGYGASLK